MYVFIIYDGDGAEEWRWTMHARMVHVCATLIRYVTCNHGVDVCGLSYQSHSHIHIRSYIDAASCEKQMGLWSGCMGGSHDVIKIHQPAHY